MVQVKIILAGLIVLIACFADQASAQVVHTVDGRGQSILVQPTMQPVPVVVTVSPESNVRRTRVVSPPVQHYSPSMYYSFQQDGIPSRVQREEIRSLPIEKRPYRPGHFYGNRVRRRGR